ncbi:MAG: serine/threonine-protein kinase, partial [Hyphomicrobiaceae bacterium]
MRSVLATGTLLDGSYRIERLLGVGGFGITYMAHDERLNRPVALKEYFPSMLALRDAQGTVRAQDGERNKELFQWGLERFIEEARLLAQLEHPNIVRVNRVCEAYGTAYMVQEYIDGESLGHWLEALRRPPTQSELDALVEPLLDALEVVHSHSMFHRDIAPDNILVRASGVPTLVDFGSARALVGKETQTLAAIVKPGYSPKEQYSTDLRVQGAWSDIYAFAATLYRAVSGSVPADALSRDVSDTMPRAAIIARGRYRQAFLNAIDMAMLPRPGDRPQSIKVWRAMMLDMPAPQTKEPSPPSPFSPLTPRPITIDTPTLQVERSPLHLKEKATNWLLLLGLLVGSAISLFFLSKLPNPLEGLTQRPERQAQTPKTRLPAAPPENPTDQLALFRDRISSGMDQFDRSISGTQAAKSR